MDHPTIEFHPSKRDRMIRPALGAVAALATALTFGLLVVGPATLALDGGTTTAALAPVATPAPIEVAIVPASIDVVAKRTPLARAETGPIVLIAYRAR